MAGGSGRTCDGFDRAQVGSQVGITQPGKKGLHRLETAPERKTENAAEAAHLSLGDAVILMRLQAGVKDTGNDWVFLQKAGDLKRAAILPIDAQVERFHSAEQ